MGRFIKGEMIPPKPIDEEDDDEFERRLLNDPRFLARVERSRKAFREGKGVLLEDIDWDEGEKETEDRTTAGEQGS